MPTEYYHFSVKFVVFSKENSTSHLSDFFGIDADETTVKGAPIPYLISKYYINHSWSLVSKLNQEAELDAHIRWFMEVLPVEKTRQIKGLYDLQFSCVVKSNDLPPKNWT